MNEITKSKTQWNRLSAEAFVKALQGETIKDEDGKELNFLEKKGEWHGFAVIMREVIVEDSIELSKGNTYTYPIKIASGDFKNDFRIVGGDFKDDFQITGGNFNSLFQIHYGNFQSLFQIAGGNFKSSFWVIGGHFQSRFRIDGGRFQSRFRIDGGDFNSRFWIDGGNFESDFWITSGDFKFRFQISGGNFKSGFQIYNGNFKSSFWITGGNFQSDFGITNGDFNSRFQIDGGNFKSDFWIIGGDFKSGFRITEGDFKFIRILNHKGYFDIIELATTLQYTMRIENAKVNDFIFKGLLSNQGRLYLKNISLNRMVVENFINESLISADHIVARNSYYEVDTDNKKDKIRSLAEKQKPSSLSLESSDLGNMSFFDTTFKAFKSIVIKNCRFTGVKTTGKHFPVTSGKKDKQVVTDWENNQNPIIMEETYNQLYLAMKNSGNRTWEMRYYAEYMEWHRKRLKMEGTEPFTRVTLWLNKWTNNYNKNWLRATLLTLLIAFVCYMGYYLSIWGWNFRSDNLSWSGLFYHCGNYIQFLFPTRKFNFIQGVELGSSSVFIDGISRIIIGYMIYQTITAFRRFGRR